MFLMVKLIVDMLSGALYHIVRDQVKHYYCRVKLAVMKLIVTAVSYLLQRIIKEYKINKA